VTFDIEVYHEIVRLTVRHENLADASALGRQLVRMASGVRQPQVSARNRLRIAA
jgi:hypothetical protein